MSDRLTPTQMERLETYFEALATQHGSGVLRPLWTGEGLRMAAEAGEHFLTKNWFTIASIAARVASGV